MGRKRGLRVVSHGRRVARLGNDQEKSDSSSHSESEEVTQGVQADGVEVNSFMTSPLLSRGPFEAFDCANRQSHRHHRSIVHQSARESNSSKHRLCDGMPAVSVPQLTTQNQASWQPPRSCRFSGVSPPALEPLPVSKKRESISDASRKYHLHDDTNTPQLSARASTDVRMHDLNGKQWGKEWPSKLQAAMLGIQALTRQVREDIQSIDSALPHAHHPEMMTTSGGIKHAAETVSSDLVRTAHDRSAEATGESCSSRHSQNSKFPSKQEFPALSGVPAAADMSHGHGLLDWRAATLALFRSDEELKATLLHLAQEKGFKERRETEPDNTSPRWESCEERSSLTLQSVSVHVPSALCSAELRSIDPQTYMRSMRGGRLESRGKVELRGKGDRPVPKLWGQGETPRMYHGVEPGEIVDVQAEKAGTSAECFGAGGAADAGKEQATLGFSVRTQLSSPDPLGLGKVLNETEHSHSLEQPKKITSHNVTSVASELAERTSKTTPTPGDEVSATSASSDHHQTPSSLQDPTAAIPYIPPILQTSGTNDLVLTPRKANSNPASSARESSGNTPRSPSQPTWVQASSTAVMIESAETSVFTCGDEHLHTAEGQASTPQISLSALSSAISQATCAKTAPMSPSETLQEMPNELLSQETTPSGSPPTTPSHLLSDSDGGDASCRSVSCQVDSGCPEKTHPLLPSSQPVSPQGRVIRKKKSRKQGKAHFKTGVTGTAAGDNVSNRGGRTQGGCIQVVNALWASAGAASRAPESSPHPERIPSTLRAQSTGGEGRSGRGAHRSIQDVRELFWNSDASKRWSMKDRDSPSRWQQRRDQALKGPRTIHTGDTADAADAAKIGKAAKIHAGNCAVPAAAGASCATLGDAVAPAKGCSGCDRRGRDADEDTARRPSYSLAPLPAIPKVFLRGRPVPWTPRGKGLSAEKEKSVLVGTTGLERVDRVENREAQAKHSAENEPKFEMQKGVAGSEVETAAGRSAKPAKLETELATLPADHLCAPAAASATHSIMQKQEGMLLTRALNLRIKAVDNTFEFEEKFATPVPAEALFAFAAAEDDELRMAKGELVVLLGKAEEDWYIAINADGESGVVPTNYVKIRTEAEAGLVEQQSGEGKVRHASEEASQRASEERRQNLLRMAEVQRVSDSALRDLAFGYSSSAPVTAPDMESSDVTSSDVSSLNSADASFLASHHRCDVEYI